MKVRVCDALMGQGKTQSCIRYMNEQTDKKFIFVTPYLAEVERIIEGCAVREFKQPLSEGGTKLDALHRLLAAGSNIASTHALFAEYNPKTCRLIQEGGYSLIMDEVFEVIQEEDIADVDLDMLLRADVLALGDDGISIKRGKAPYTFNGTFGRFVDKATRGLMFKSNAGGVFWQYPIEVFQYFDEVTVLTYLFDSSVLKSYWDLHGVDITYIGIEVDDQGHRFCDTPCENKYPGLIDKIHIVQHTKLNDIGKTKFSLSASWYKGSAQRGDQPEIKRMRRNLKNLFQNILDVDAASTMWTVYERHRDQIKGQGYTNGFVSCNLKSTNEFRDRTALAYCINLYMNPFFKQYFERNGIEVNEDMFALSSMIQWIWRSAIRDGHDITIYVPSERMRKLLQDWLITVSF